MALDPYRVSASRMDLLLTCGQAFQYRYIDGLPGEVLGGKMLFGRVLHKALEAWALDRSQGLVGLVEKGWRQEVKGTAVEGFLRAYEPLAREARALMSEIRRARPTVKVVRSTKEYTKSDVNRDIRWLVESKFEEMSEGSPWRFTRRDSLPHLYDDSLSVARAYAKKWKDLPTAYDTEFAFEVPFYRWRLEGIIDTLEPVVRGNEIVALAVFDYKTDAEIKHDAKYWRQRVIYEIAVQHLLIDYKLKIPRGVEKLPLYVGIDYVRHGIRRAERITPSDRQRLQRELEIYSRVVKENLYLPAGKLHNSDFCQYPEHCCLRGSLDEWAV